MQYLKLKCHIRACNTAVNHPTSQQCLPSTDNQKHSIPQEHLALSRNTWTASLYCLASAGLAAQSGEFGIQPKSERKPERPSCPYLLCSMSDRSKQSVCNHRRTINFPLGESQPRPSSLIINENSFRLDRRFQLESDASEPQECIEEAVILSTLIPNDTDLHLAPRHDD